MWSKVSARFCSLIPLDCPEKYGMKTMSAGSTGTIFVIAAPSGGGKTSLIHALVERVPDMLISVSHTTRPPRPQERSGQHYHFVSEAEFQSLQQSQAFIESAKVFGHYYGTSKAALASSLSAGRDVLLDIDWQGAQQVRHLFPGQNVTVFILPPSKTALQARLCQRNQDSEDVVKRRMIAATDEMAHYHEFDYLLVNDDFDQALNTLAAIVVAERHRQCRQAKRLDKLLTELLA